MTETIDTPEVVEADSVELEVRDRSLLGVTDPVAVIDETKRVANALKAELHAGGMVQRIGTSDHVKLEGWQTLATMLGLVAVITWTRPLENGWEARAEARTLDGRVVGAGEGMCLRDERNWSRRDSYQLRAMSQSRAMSRALRAPLGFVMTLSGYAAAPAEEVDSTATVVPPTPELPQWAKPVGDVTPAAQALVAVFRAARVPEPAERTVEIGKRVRDRCEGKIPVCVLGVLEDVRDAITGPAQDDDSEKGS